MPFCGNSDYVFEYTRTTADDVTDWVECRNCCIDMNRSSWQERPLENNLRNALTKILAYHTHNMTLTDSLKKEIDELLGGKTVTEFPDKQEGIENA